jgi:alpha-galactosidase
VVATQARSATKRLTQRHSLRGVLTTSRLVALLPNFTEGNLILHQYDNCFPPEEWYDDCLSCEPDPSFSPTGISNGTCSKNTPPVNHYSFDRPIPICADGWPVDGINYTAKYTALKFRIMGNALLAQNRTILYSLCEWGVDLPWTWANKTGQSWRMSNDINRK